MPEKVHPGTFILLAQRASDVKCCTATFASFGTDALPTAADCSWMSLSSILILFRYSSRIFFIICFLGTSPTRNGQQCGSWLVHSRLAGTVPSETAATEQETARYDVSNTAILFTYNRTNRFPVMSLSTSPMGE